MRRLRFIALSSVLALVVVACGSGMSQVGTDCANDAYSIAQTGSTALADAGLAETSGFALAATHDAYSGKGVAFHFASGITFEDGWASGATEIFGEYAGDLADAQCELRDTLYEASAAGIAGLTDDGAFAADWFEVVGAIAVVTPAGEAEMTKWSAVIMRLEDGSFLVELWVLDDDWTEYTRTGEGETLQKALEAWNVAQVEIAGYRP